MIDYMNCNRKERKRWQLCKRILALELKHNVQICFLYLRSAHIMLDICVHVFHKPHMLKANYRRDSRLHNNIFSNRERILENTNASKDCTNENYSFWSPNYEEFLLTLVLHVLLSLTLSLCFGLIIFIVLFLLTCFRSKYY